MIIVQDWASLSRALTSPLDIRLKQLLIERRDQLAEFDDLSEIARFIIVQPGDSLDDLEKELGFSIFRNPVDGRLFGDTEFSPGWEWLANHDSVWEICFIYDDSGFGHVVIIPNEQGIDPALLRLCQAYAD